VIIRPESTSPRDFYRHMIAAITPRPIAWVSTLSPRGVANLAPYSFFNGVSANPPALMFAAANRRDGSRKDSLVNAEATGEFVVNIVSHALAVPMNASSADLPYETDEFEVTGLAKSPSTLVKPPRVADALVAFECRLHQIVRLGEGPLAGNIAIGLILAMHIGDSVLTDGGIDPDKLDTIGRMGGAAYCTTRSRFDLDRPPAPG
jgi:flavin reductase (DIM6/NTAB) family NADH-FMN oxidoreductase RutF